jgi:hypothetical protein
VYECNVNGNHVMRRRADDWINATHILKVADYDKPARTRILEREVQKGVHEKVQGGYGKYQGTWIPLEEGRHLAERNGVLHKMRLRARRQEPTTRTQACYGCVQPHEASTTERYCLSCCCGKKCQKQCLFARGHAV